MVSAETKLEIISTLRSKKGPYECPLCSRMYRSISGVSYHIMKFDHDNPPEGYDPNCIAIRPTPQSPKQPTAVDSSPNRPSRRVNFVTLESPSRHKRQPLTYAEAQRMVEFDLNGEMLRTLITDNLPLEKEVEKVVEENASVTPLKQVFTPRHYKSKFKFTRRKSKVSQKKDAAKGDSLPRSSLPTPSFREQDPGSIDKKPRSTTYFRFIEKSAEEMDEEVEYDMDEEDYAWLEIVNEERQKEGSSIITQEVFEMLMDRLEKESHFETQTVNGDPYNLIDEDAVCCICNDGECSNSNVILFCDMCNLAVHQECYGVPYIPEGQWLCKRCLQSPSKPVDCVLCPNKSGAFKQTDDNRWAHVVCALWIPEVCFANTVFLEPVDSIQNIPPARWKLLCYICKKKEGACIQCFKTNCYTAFHVTCAAQASLHMKMEPSRTESGQPSVKKTAFCDLHTPKNSDSSQTFSDEESEISMDMKVTLPKKKPLPSQEDSNPAKDFSKAGVDKPNSRPPIVHIPFVPPHRLSKIASRVAISRKAQFIQMLQSYWMLKRQSRNGVPLLRRLQATSNGVSRNHKEELEASDQAKALKEQLKYWQQLRHDLERARLLVELIRKREKMKREQYKVQQHITNLQMQPMNFVLRRTLDSLQTKDTSDIFADPVDIEEVPDYLDHIEHPMDFSTMRRKIENHEYLNFDQFENDFYLMLSNCMSYNEKDTIYYKAAVILRNLGRPILKGARRKMQLSGIDPDTGLHSEKVLPPPCESVGLGDEEMSNMERKEITLEEKLRDLEDKLEMTATVKSSAARVSRQKMLRKEIGAIKRKMKKRDRLSFSSHDSSAVADGQLGCRIEGLHTSEEGIDEQEDVKRPKVEPLEESSMLNMAMTSSSFSPPSTPTPTTNAIANPSPGRSRRSGILFNKGYYRSNGTTPIPVLPHLNISSESEDGNSLRSPIGLSQFNGLSNNNLERHLYLDQAKINELFSQREPIVNSYGHGNGGRRSSGEHRRFFPNDSVDEYQHHDADKEESHDGHGNSFKTHNGFQETFSETSSEEVLENPKSMDSIDSPYYHCFSGNPGEKVNRKRTYTSSSANSDSEGPGRRRFGGHKRGRKPLKKVYPCSEDFSCIDLEDMQSGIYMIGTDDVGNKALRDPKQDPEVLYPMDLVWAKCRGYPAYPAMIVDPGMPRGFSHHGVPIPVPPIDVLNMRNDCDDFEDRYLVLFFDLRRTWQWLTRCKLEPLGVDAGLDKVKLIEGRKISMRKSVRQAYERALMHRKRVLRNYSDNEVDSESSIEGPS